MGARCTSTSKVISIPINSNELKTQLSKTQRQLIQYRDKKVNNIKTKKMEVIKNITQDNLTVAKMITDLIIKEENIITAINILAPFCEILSEKVSTILYRPTCTVDIKPYVDTIIYSSIRIEIESFQELRQLFIRKYGAEYVNSAINNTDLLVNKTVLNMLLLEPASDRELLMKMKQICKEYSTMAEYRGQYHNYFGGCNNDDDDNNNSFDLDDPENDFDPDIFFMDIIPDNNISNQYDNHVKRNYNNKKLNLLQVFMKFDFNYLYANNYNNTKSTDDKANELLNVIYHQIGLQFDLKPMESNYYNQESKEKTFGERDKDKDEKAKV